MSIIYSNRLQLLEPFDAWDGNDLMELPILIKVSFQSSSYNTEKLIVYRRLPNHCVFVCFV